MGGLAGMFGHGDLGISTDLFAITDLKYLQFGAGLLTHAALANPAATSLADHELFRKQGVCTPVELYAYLNHANGPLAAGGDLHAVAVGLAAYAGLPSEDTISLRFSMSIAQAKAFLETMYMPQMEDKTKTSEEIVEAVVKRGANRKLVRTMTVAAK